MELVLRNGDRGRRAGHGARLAATTAVAGRGVRADRAVPRRGRVTQRVSFARFAIGMVHDARGAALRRLIADEKQARRARTGDVIARTTADAARLKAGVKGGLIDISQNGVYVLGVGAVLVVVDGLLGVVFLTGGAVAFAVGYLGAVRIARVARRHRRKEGQLADTLHDALAAGDGTKPIGPTNRKSGRADAKANRLEGVTTWTAHGVLALSASVVAYLGLRGVSTGRLQPGELFLVLAYVLLAHISTVRLVRYTARLGKILSNAERLAKLVGPPTQPPGAPTTATRLFGPLASIGCAAPFTINRG